MNKTQKSANSSDLNHLQDPLINKFQTSLELERIPELDNSESQPTFTGEQTTFTGAGLKPILFKINFESSQSLDGVSQILVREGDDLIQNAFDFSQENNLSTDQAKKVYQHLKMAYGEHIKK